MLTVLQLISSGGYYGAESMLVGLARALHHEGCRPIVGIFQDARSPHTEVAEEARRHGLQVEVIPCTGRVDWSTVGHIHRIIDDCRVDVLHSHGYKADCYAFAAAWPRRAARFATSHNWPNKLASMQGYAKVDRMILRHFDGIAVVSDVVAGMLQRSGVPAGRITTVRNGVAIDSFGAPPVLRHERGWTRDRIIGFVGRLVPDKGGEILLHAAQSVVAAHPDTRLVFVGEGPARQQWEALAAQLGIGDRVSFTGARHDMPAVYASFNLVVLPSLNEAMPMCLIEAMAAGKPVIGTNVGAVPKVIVPGETGFLVEPGDIAALQSAMLRLIEDPELAHRFGINGAAHAAEHFSDRQMAKSYLGLYGRAMANYQRRCRPNAWRQWVRRLWTTSESQSL